jgi:NAD(P)H-dependent flavin oxidoreductase YrpB (nitropropane dioxygenase family)
MGGVSSPPLALAASRAGGIGTISVLPGTSVEDLTAQLDDMTGATSGVLAVNFLTDNLDPKAIELAACRVPVIDFFWNTPRAGPVEIAHAAGALVNWQIGSVADAEAAVAAGADVVTVQGIEAGGHVRGDTALLPLLTAVLAAVPVPVLAAGGIADARSLAAVLAAGAAGARIGTRFIAATESGAHPEYVAAVLRAGPGSTEITGEFGICPLCATLPRARVLSSAIRAVTALPDENVGIMPVAGGEMALPKGFGMPPHREVRGRIDAMALYAGQSVGAVTEVKPAASIIHDLVQGAEDLLRVW